MKKMPYAIIFVLIVCILVFAGCKHFSGGEDSTDEPIETTEETPGTPTTLPGETTSDEIVTLDPGTLPGETTTVPGETSTDVTGTTGEETTVPGDAATTTANAPEGTATTAPAPAVTASPVPAVPEGKTEYDVMRSGTFFMRGSMNDGRETTPLVLAVKADDGTMYMESSMDNAAMGFLITEKKILLLNPQAKAYCEMGGVLQSILKEAGMPTQEEMQAKIKEMGFTEMPELSKAAKVEDGAVNGVPCRIYTFNKEDGGATRVYLNGAKLLCFERLLKGGGLDSATYVTELTSAVPQLPPADYEKQNVVKFMTSMESLIG